MQALLVDILELAGTTTQAVGRGDTALLLIRQQAPSLVILDVDLPGTLSGLDVLRTIRNDAGLKATKVILLTAQHPAARTPEAEVADLVLLKPVAAEQLISLTERLLGAGV